MSAIVEPIFECVNQHVVQLTYRWKIYCQLFDSGPENIALLNASGGNVFLLFQSLVPSVAGGLIFLVICAEHMHRSLPTRANPSVERTRNGGARSFALPAFAGQPHAAHVKR